MSAACPCPSTAFGEAMQRKVIISCAVTGSADTPGRNPAVPVTPEQIANSVIDAAKAGAAIVHIHVRDPKTTKPSMDTALYREVASGSGQAAPMSSSTSPPGRVPVSRMTIATPRNRAPRACSNPPKSACAT
jgi:uncharacterized protein (DUF849 family)